MYELHVKILLTLISLSYCLPNTFYIKWGILFETFIFSFILTFNFFTQFAIFICCTYLLMCTYILYNFTKNSLLDILMVTISFKFISLNILMQCITHAILQTFTYPGCRFECYGILSNCTIQMLRWHHYRITPFEYLRSKMQENVWNHKPMYMLETCTFSQLACHIDHTLK